MSKTITTKKNLTPFSFSHLFRFPENLASDDIGGIRKKVAIVGAGIAGLVAGYELKKRGHQVHLFEASQRIGGRIKTHFFNDGTYGELGAKRIPVHHEYVLHYIKEFGLETTTYVNQNPEAYYYARGLKTRIKNWKSLFEKFQLLPDEQKEPSKLYGDILSMAFNSLSDEEKWDIFNSNFDSPRLKNYEEQTLWQFLKKRLSYEAMDYIGATTSILHQKKASFLAILLDHFSVLHGDKLSIVGGMQQLPNAFASRLKDEISYNACVKKIHIQENTVCITWNQLELWNKQEEFDCVIVTAPLPALLKIDFQPCLPVLKREAIRGLSYENAGKMLLHLRKRPWEFNDGIYGGGSYSDLSFQQCWYPSDNAQVMKYKNGSSIIRPKNPDISYSGGVLNCYLWGDNALRFAALSHNERLELLVKDLELLHPEISKYLDDAVSISWDTQSNPGCGAHAFFSPGEHQRYQQVLTKPFPAEQPRIFFAGEHLGIIHGCIQGAIQTALSTTMEILKLPITATSLQTVA